MTFLSSGNADHDAAYRKAVDDIAGDIVDGTFIAGQNWASVWTRDTSYSVDLGAGLLHPDVAMATMRGMTSNDGALGEVWVQDRAGHFGGWPNLTDSIVGAVGAWSTYLLTGDREFLRWSHTVTTNTLARAERDAFDAESGLFRGCSSFMESNSGYPGKYAFDGAAVGRTKALSTNLLYHRGYVLGARMGALLGEDVESLDNSAARLRTSINERLWLPDNGYYAYYEDEDGMLSDRMEGLGESLAVLWGVASPSQAADIMQSTPTTAQGLPCLWPQYPEWKDYSKDFASYYHNGMVWPFVQGYWARAAAKTGDVAVFGAELDKVLALSKKDATFHEFYRPEDGFPDGSPRQLWSAAGYLSMIYHGLFGLRPGTDSLRFAPVVPAAFQQVTLTDIRYRDMTLAISLAGSGTRVTSFTVDGQVNTEAAVPVSLTGSHTVRITVA
ncbi:MAG: hypothetical protein JOZ47_05825 [Kutzneria sp.]|nr:hypothetical protein [Kutzneria sp.]MBV9844571.1 hypothetical protein [Kutzneria sp.]